jgi:hypothetical protein
VSEVVGIEPVEMEIVGCLRLRHDHYSLGRWTGWVDEHPEDFT